MLVRPSEHTLSGGFLVALRRVVIGAGVPPVLAAASLALSEGDATPAIYGAIGVLTLIEAFLLLLIWRAYRAGRIWRAKLEAHADASLIE